MRASHAQRVGALRFLGVRSRTPARMSAAFGAAPLFSALRFAHAARILLSHRINIVDIDGTTSRRSFAPVTRRPRARGARKELQIGTRETRVAKSDARDVFT